MERSFLFGAGYSARAYARVAGVAEIFGTTRSAENAALLQAAGITPLLFDGKELGEEARARLADTTALIISVAPEEAGDPVLATAGGFIEENMPRLAWIGYLSTIGVYGDQGGAWIDEDTRPAPTSLRSRWRLDAENAWSALGDRLGVPVALLRIAGIYGPGRNALVRLARGTARRLVKPGQVFNRIHVEDIGRAIAFVAGRRLGGPFNLADGSPSPAEEVIAFAAALSGMEAPPEIPFGTARLTPMELSFYSENKRAAPARLLREGFTFRHPDYREALTRMWQDGNWQSE